MRKLKESPTLLVGILIGIAAVVMVELVMQ